MRGTFQKSILHLILFTSIGLAVSGQGRIAEFKIDPVYRYMIEANKSKSADPISMPAFVKNITPTKGIVLANNVLDERYECIVYTKNSKMLVDSGIVIHSSLPTFVTAWVTLAQISMMATLPQVEYIEAPQLLHKVNDLVVGSSGASLLHQRKLNNTVYKGKNVIVAIFDSGIDWKHLDFRNPVDTTKSRILRIWDQTISAVSGEAPPAGFSYGVEYTQAQINDEIDGTPANFVREKDTDGHGTHVAGTAVSNGRALPSAKYSGMAPEADIVVIKGGDSTFSDNRSIDAMTYLKNLSTALGKPVVLNISSGSLYGPHDGTRPVELAIDNFTASAAGRAVAVSAGNDGGTNKHNVLNVNANSSSSVTFNVPAITSGSEVFSYMMYANSNATINASFNAPTGNPVTANAGQTTNGTVLNNSFNVYLINSVDPANNNRYIELKVERNGSNTTSAEGTYTLTLTNTTSGAAKMDGWMYKINSAFKATTLVNGDNNYLVSSPGNASTAITVGSYVARLGWYTAFNSSRAYTAEREDSISSFSSAGPRRDNVLKPEITADGQGVISCLSSTINRIDSAFVIEKGLYSLRSGTSMATPAVSGGVALLLQANASATSAQLKSLITSNATKGGMTELPGAIPNTTWGYGKFDVFKAASALFNCAPAERKTYKYDSSTRNSEQTGYRVTTERVGVRFTPDITGKLAGIYFQTRGLATNLVAEVRSNSSGNPGAILGSLNIASTLIQKYSWNYFDISNLNISVTSGTDYFVVFYRDPASTEDWTVGAENIVVDNRSVLSTNNGTSWGILTADLKIRSVVYNNAQLPGIIATTNSTDTRNINGSNQFINSNCQLIAQVIANGINPVTGSITSRVWIESSVPRVGTSAFVPRHYQILPATGTNTTGSVTLYFTQAEFNAFNNDPASILDLPANPTDVAGKANLRVGRYAGSSSDNTGLPASYTASPSVIDPADGDIVWNAALNRWEVTFDVTGFGGYFIQTNTASTIVGIEYFRGNLNGATNLLSWKVNCTNTTTSFELERSSDGITFTVIGTMSSTLDRCLQPFSFEDPTPLANKNYYRLKITDTRSTIFSDIVLLEKGSQTTNQLYPTIVKRGSSVTVRFNGLKGSLNVYDGTGRRIFSKTLSNGTQPVQFSAGSSGIYFYTIRDENSVLLTGKVVVQ